MHGNQGIEKIPHHRMQVFPKPLDGVSSDSYRLTSDTRLREGDLTPTEATKLTMLCDIYLRQHGIGNVKILKIAVTQSAICLSLRYFSPLDKLADAAKILPGIDRKGRYQHYVITVAPNAFVHWRKYDKRAEQE